MHAKLHHMLIHNLTLVAKYLINTIWNNFIFKGEGIKSPFNSSNSAIIYFYDKDFIFKFIFIFGYSGVPLLVFGFND